MADCKLPDITTADRQLAILAEQPAKYPDKVVPPPHRLGMMPTDAGRKPCWSDRAELEQAIQLYFDECDQHIISKQVVQKGEIVTVPTPEPYTMAGLADALGVSRNTLNRYNRDSIFSDVIAHARNKIERQNIVLGLIGVHDSRMAALNASSNFGYSDRSETVHRDGTVEDVLRALLGDEE